MSSPWPQIEASRCDAMAERGKVFSYERCAGCTRWFPSERAIGEAAPTLCPWVCDRPKRTKARATEPIAPSPPMPPALSEGDGVLEQLTLFERRHP